MNQKELIQTIANLSGLPRVAIREILCTAGDVVAETLAEGAEDVALPGFGKFRSIRRAPRLMRLPPLGEQRLVAGKRVGKFFASESFRKRVNGEI
jgi:DNA-binding protein HU-beta